MSRPFTYGRMLRFRTDRSGGTVYRGILSLADYRADSSGGV